MLAAIWEACYDEKDKAQKHWRTYHGHHALLTEHWNDEVDEEEHNEDNDESELHVLKKIRN